MKFIAKYRIPVTGLLIFLMAFSLHFFLINDYGVTWDYTYHYNAGLWHLKLPVQDAAFSIRPHAPLSDIFPALSRYIFYDKLHFLQWDNAYNLYGILVGSAGVAAVYFISAYFFGAQTAMISAVTFALLPRYFGHLHNNMKDIPQTVFFSVSVFLFYLLSVKKTFIYLILSSVLFALAFNIKVNAVFVPAIGIIYYVILFLSGKNILKSLFSRKNIMVTSYFFLSAALAYLVWSLFWDKPFLQLLSTIHTHTTSTTNMPVLYFGRLYYSGNNVPWNYPLGILFATTPLIVQVGFIIGLVYLFPKILKKDKTAVFIILWFFIPLLRYLKPKMIVIDDVRHFMECLVPYCLISGIGLFKLVSYISSYFSKFNTTVSKHIRKSFLLIYILYLFYINYSIHPYQTSYFSETVGGTKGAQHQFDIEFWAASYKEAAGWINKNVSSEDKLLIPMAPDIMKLYLNENLKNNINNENMAFADSRLYGESDYTVVINRESFFNWYGIYPYIKNRVPIYQIERNSVPIVSIYKNN